MTAVMDTPPGIDEVLIHPAAQRNLRDVLGAEAYTNLIDKFCVTLPAKIGAIGAIIFDGAAGDAKMSIHSLKGVAANLGFQRLRFCLNELENLRKAETSIPLEAFAKLELTARETITALETAA